MSDNKKRAETLLFNYETTSRTDFRDGEIKPIVATVYQTKPTRPRPPAKPLKNLHAMTDWRVANIPFDLYHKPTPIIRTYPKLIQNVYIEPQNTEKEEVQKTRPRLVMTPAISLDDLDPEYAFGLFVIDKGRNKLIEEVYTTSTQRAWASVDVAQSMRAPFKDHFAPAQPITIEKLLPPYVSPEWRMDSASWDRRQLRAATHPTKQFWRNKLNN